MEEHKLTMYYYLLDVAQLCIFEFGIVEVLALPLASVNIFNEQSRRGE